MTTVTPAQSLSSPPLRRSIEAGIIQMLASPINPDRSSSGKVLWNVYFWQVVGEIAAEKEKAAWKELQKAGGLVDDDDKLRSLSKGEHIAAESNKFTAMITVAAPRLNFDRDEFVAEVARKYRVAKKKLEALVEKCKHPGAAPLTKRIIESE